MPNVAGKEYAYTPKGMAQAKRAAKRQGKNSSGNSGSSGKSKGFNGTPKPQTRK
tara:strand:- start:4209 stop:4370 length:162 start_codon:yes stop_codon:yes gene_type:complete